VLTRRGAIVGGLTATAAAVAAAVSVEHGVLPGRPAVQSLLGLNGEPGVVPDVAAGPVEQGVLESSHRPGKPSDWAVLRPPGSTGPLPVVVALHGHGDTVADLLGPSFGLPQYLAAAVAGGTAPYAIAAIDGGDTYWHPDPDGSDTGAMVIDDFLPLLGSQGLLVDRVGLLGWSMGGYGVLRLAGLLGAARVSAVVATSPAIWDGWTTHPLQGDPTSEGFVDEATYERLGVRGKQAQLDGIAVRVDCGTGDAFYPAARHYVDDFPSGSDVVGHFDPGAHGQDYWRRVLPSELAWLGRRVPAAATGGATGSTTTGSGDDPA